LDSIVQIFREHYALEKIEGTQRIKVELIPLEAFREVIANALVHREWDVVSAIRVSMHPDRIEVVSPGSLPDGITEVEYHSGYLSVPRNPILATVFFRLGLIEKFGTVVVRIKQAYRDSAVKPEFHLTPSAIGVTLPVVRAIRSLTEDEATVLGVLGDEALSRASIQDASGLSRDATIRVLNALLDYGLAERTGAGPSTAYRLADQ
jgi:ATP-dependent DNA helicase RecG